MRVGTSSHSVRVFTVAAVSTLSYSDDFSVHWDVPALKIITSNGDTFLPTDGEVRNGLSEDLLMHSVQFNLDSILEFGHISEDPASENVLELGENGKVTRGKIWGVGWMGQKVNSPLPDLAQSEVGDMNRRVVLMQDEFVWLTSFAPKLWAFAPDGFLQP